MNQQQKAQYFSHSLLGARCKAVTMYSLRVSEWYLVHLLGPQAYLDATVIALQCVRIPWTEEVQFATQVGQRDQAYINNLIAKKYEAIQSKRPRTRLRYQGLALCCAVPCRVRQRPPLYR